MQKNKTGRLFYWKRNLAGKLHYIILTVMAPLILCIVLEMVMLGEYANRYAEITNNVNVSSQFSNTFKDTVDLKMYYFSVGVSSQTEPPVEEVDNALNLAYSLQKNTEYASSRKSIENVMVYCKRLKEYMYETVDIQNYDERMQMLENNIYVLTNLIEGEIMNYIYYEAGYLAELESQMMYNIRVFILAVSAAVLLLILWSWRRSLRFISGITTPIRKLCENVRQVGGGNFAITSVNSDDTEIQELDSGIQKMSKQIEELLENVKQEEKLQYKTELQLLQAQINPHFLYNTLDTIVWMVEAGMHDGAIEMLTSLSVFFRTVLSRGEDVIPLREEKRHTKSYLDIQKMRYRDILEYSIDVPKELEEYLIPKLTLQPLVENALYHGVKEKRGSSTITVTCEDAGDDILIYVKDNGIGMKAEQLAELRNDIRQKGKGGFGMSAVEGRLRLYFGEGYGMHIESEYGKGTVITVRIAKKMQMVE